MSDVPRSLQSWVSTIQQTGRTHSRRFSTSSKNICLVLFLSWKTSAVSTTVWMVNVSCEYDRHNINVAKRQLWKYFLKLKNVSCEYDRLNGWNLTLQAAWYIRHVRVILEVWFLWTKPTIWLFILSFTQNVVRACSMFYPYEGYRSVTPLDAASVNRTIFHNHSVHWYYITLPKTRAPGCA